MSLFYRHLCLALLLFVATCIQAQVSLVQINSPHQQNFDSLLSTGTANEFSTFPYGWMALETGTNANTTYASTTGTSNAGNTYSFGTTPERALGGLQSGSLIPIVGAYFVNNTGATITALQIVYRGEQWRLGTSGRTDKLDFQFSTNASALNNGTWNDMDALDFNAPNSIGTVGALNGNDTLNSDIISATIEGLTIAHGSVFFIRWTDFNASGADDGLGVDDFTITPIGLDPGTPSITFAPAALDFGEVNAGSSDTLHYHVNASNLTDSIAIFTFRPEYSISTDGIHFRSSLTLQPDGGKVVVRFSPTTNGTINDSALHVSSGTIKSISITGQGFVQASNIISIATARTKPIGTRVTVAGRITVGNELGNPAYIQDVTGGIPVFDYTMASSVHIGDSIIVTGPIGVFNNQVQISGSNIIFANAGGPAVVRVPKLIGAHELAAHEGQLVTVRNVRLVNSNFVFYPQSTEILTNDTTSIDLRIDGDTDIPGLTKPQGLVNVTGVVGRFRTNAQLLPRFSNDIPGADEPTTPADSIPKSKTLDIVNWNFEFFGATREDYPEEYGPADEALQLSNIMAVLDSLDADIVAVQEVSDDSTFSVLVRQLGHYKGFCSNRYSYSFDGPSHTFPPQKVCYIYDSLTVTALSSRPMFENLYDSARLYDGTLLPGYPSGNASSFYSSGRLPYMLEAAVEIDGIESTIALINIHAKSGATAIDRERRAYDAQVLKDSLDAHYPTRNFVILGDLNDDLDTSIASGLASPYVDFVTDTSHYSPVTKALSDAGARSTVSFADVIDHQILSDDVSHFYIGGSAAIATPFSMIKNYATTTSDHLPVITRYRLQAPAVDFVDTSVTLVEKSTGTYRVSLVASKASAQDRTIIVRVSGSATVFKDYHTSVDSSGTTLYIPLPADSVDASFNFSMVDDLEDEVTETAVFEIQPAFGLTPGNSTTFVLTIEDNDIPEISFTQLLASGYEGSGDHEIKLKLSTAVATSQDITLQLFNNFGAVYGSDYVTSPSAINNRINLRAAAGNSEVIFTLIPLSDAKREFAELVSFQIAAVSDGLKIKNPTISVFTILDSRLKNIFLNIAPNPTTTTARLVTEGIDANGMISLELRRSTGELMMSVHNTVDQVNVALENKIQQAPRGVYIIKVVHDGEVYQLRVVKS